MPTQTSPNGKADSGRLKPYGVRQHLFKQSNWPLDEQAAAYILMFGELLGFWGARVYTGHTLNRKDDGWLITVRATHKGKHEVAFASGPTQQEAIKAFAIALTSNLLQWREDRFKPKA